MNSIEKWIRCETIEHRVVWSAFVWGWWKDQIQLFSLFLWFHDTWNFSCQTRCVYNSVSNVSKLSHQTQCECLHSGVFIPFPSLVVGFSISWKWVRMRVFNWHLLLSLFLRKEKSPRDGQGNGTTHWSISSAL